MSATCSETLRSSPEPTGGTAPLASGWIGIEVDGSWGRKALTSSALDPDIGARLADRAGAAGVKAVLIRRPGRHAATSEVSRTVLLAHAGAQPWMERLLITADADLDGLDPTVCARPDPPGLGESLADPHFLVCTHARRDRCCATLGRPIADTIAALHSELAWEVSHLGGHRFAGNLLVLPHGLVYGSLDVAAALAVVSATLSGAIDLDHLRGRSDLPRAAQAADIAVRRAQELDGADDVEVIGVANLVGSDTDAWAAAHSIVTVRTPRGVVELDVAREPIGSRLLSCDADAPEDPHTFRVTGVRMLGG